MKKILIPILAMVFVFSLAWIAGAQTSSSSPYGAGTSSSDQYKGQTPSSSQSRGETYGKGKHQEALMEDYKASNWIGTKVENPQGETLGKIEDLVLNSTGQVDFVIVSTGGGILGIGGKYTAVPFTAFSRKDDKTLMLDISKERLAQAPTFDKNSWPDMTDRKWSEDVYRYYGQKPSWSEPSQPSQPYHNPSQREQKGME